ncbi:ATP-binding protein [Streptomyces gibsoniae]|uniref:ATP-binding protein n=1 Tax=Streptomyces gibsoniae TaxID=3075529 RepID=A0ABU2U4D7_9ACTN|nr:ATP-binding protein [Streptomyces sp. DSM 41699]MDT0468094.1 ATP-binding protein [Streptomyces sp. DSM 41699]
MERLALLRERVRILVGTRSAEDPTAEDPLRGLYLSAEHIGRLLEGDGARPPVRPDDAYGRCGEPHGRLSLLARRFGLTDLDVHILLSALAPDVDRGFESLYGYLNDDVGRRRATVALALDLAGLAPHQAHARARFHPRAPLRSGGLLVVDDEDRPLPGRALRVPERVITHLLGEDTLDGGLPGSVRPLPVGEAAGIVGRIGPEAGLFAGRLGKLLAGGPAVVHLREHRQGSGYAAGVTTLHAAGLSVLCCDLAYGDQQAAAAVPALIREARLLGAGVVLGPLPEKPEAWVRALEEGIGAGRDVSVVIFGSAPFDPCWSPTGDILCLDAPHDDIDAELLWQSHFGDAATGFDLPATVAPYRLTARQIDGAAKAAWSLAALDGGTLGATHVQRGARQQSAPTLDRHARRVSPAVAWPDLVLPAEPRGQLEELLTRARHRERVLGQWGLRTGGGRGRGVVALFAGESGTGKTLAAEVVAGELGIDLYIVELSAVVDKYIGETEKSLERIFAEADRTNAVLLFDEADAIFGKRSEVRDSHDRYANLESAYLLQRLESFDGIAVLTTNLRANIDEAFTRRLDLLIDFPFPDQAQRLALWRHSLAGVPCADDIDLASCARDFELAGGSIRSAVVTAAYVAVGRGTPVTTDDLLAGARREYRKAGRLVPDITW